MMAEDLDSLTWAYQAIQDAGIRLTPGRVATLVVIRESSRPLTHAEVYACLSDHRIDKATVFRNLKDLVGANLLRRTELGDCVWRFEMNVEDDANTSNQNFMCMDCGSVSSLQQVSLTKDSQKLMKSLGSVSEILLRGHCHDCA